MVIHSFWKLQNMKGDSFMLSEINSLSAQPATLNAVQNFNPADYLTCYTNSDGINVYYLEVKYRLLWFRLCYPLGRIKVEIMQNDAEQILVEARVYVDMTMNDDQFIGQGIAHKYKGVELSGSYDVIEWACTAAIGRALGVAGFGQQFCDILTQAEPEQVDSPTVLTVNNKALANNNRQNRQTAPGGGSNRTAQDNQTQPANQKPKQNSASNQPQSDWAISEEIDFGDDVPVNASFASEAIDFGEPPESWQDTPMQGFNGSAQAPLDNQQPVKQNNKQSTSSGVRSLNQQPANQQTAQPNNQQMVQKQEPTNLEEALQMFTPQDCLAIPINFGFNKGKSLGDLYNQNDTKSLDWLANTYKGRDFQVKAGAQILLNHLQAS